MRAYMQACVRAQAFRGLRKRTFLFASRGESVGGGNRNLAGMLVTRMFILLRVIGNLSRRMIEN